jgi:hypothetical protein
MMFETNHDGLNQFGDEAVRGRNAIYEGSLEPARTSCAPNVLQTSRLTCE